MKGSYKGNAHAFEWIVFHCEMLFWIAGQCGQVVVKDLDVRHKAGVFVFSITKS